MEKIKVALIIRGFHSGGIEKVFESYFSHMDLSPYEIHVITHMKNDPAKKKIFTDMGCQIHELSKLHGHKLTFANIREYKELFAQNQFDIVHNNMPDNLLPLWFAKRSKVPCRILHAHNIYTSGYEKKNPIAVKLYMAGFAINTANATVLIGVSKEAARSAFGEKNMKNVMILPNAIEVDRYRFQSDLRIKMRKSLDIEDKFVIGHIGRYENDQKNQEFVLMILKELLKTEPKSHLLMIGDGKKLDGIKQMAADLGLSENVTFTGNVSNVQDYLQAMDVFVLPSRKEGLGIVAVEAQTAGLYCLVSDRVPREAKVTGNIEFLSIDHGVDPWSEAILKKRGYMRTDTSQEVISHGYDIDLRSGDLEKLYLESVGKDRTE